MHPIQHLLTCVIAFVLVVWSALSPASVTPTAETQAVGQPSQQTDPEVVIQVATFAGGCFWCMEPPFDKLDGVISTKYKFYRFTCGRDARLNAVWGAKARKP